MVAFGTRFSLTVEILEPIAAVKQEGFLDQSQLGQVASSTPYLAEHPAKSQLQLVLPGAFEQVVGPVVPLVLYSTLTLTR